ncbi:MAG: patatin-like phospholipase family protein [Rhodocyclaceae bacterium]|nr:patatin-like phospholipase family protein [Rhodocyclaceae bacterium]
MIPEPLSTSEDIRHLKGYTDILEEALAHFCGNLDDAVMQTLLARIGLARLRVGDTLYRQGEAGTSMHIVLSGRLQVRVTMTDGSERVLAHPQPGDAVGEMALFTGAGRAATVVAVRDTTLGVLDRGDIDALVASQPEVFYNVAQMIIARLTGTQERVLKRRGTRTAMLVPLHHSAAIEAFIPHLRQALLHFGSVLHLDSRSATRRLEAGEDEEYGRLLDECERSHDFVLLEADRMPSAWSRTCYGYADRIVLIADVSMGPALTELEQWLFGAAGTHRSYAEIELVLLHAKATRPTQTREWLAVRQIRQHYHVQAGDEASTTRIARFLSDNAVSLVLAGGGARGFAHLGVIRALHESGITVDAVGGASFGALAATGLARGLDDRQILEEQRLAFSRDDPLGDYTIPIVSLVRGEHLNRILQTHLPMDIEDLWLPFFAISSDLSANKVRVHERGPLWRAIRASVSLPAILPPTLEDGHLLIDGGILNNLPVDVMRDKLRGPIIAVDLAVEKEHGAEHKMIPSGMEYIKSRLLPGRQSIEAPTVSRVILQVTTLASRKEVDSARKLADLYLNPPLGNYDFLDWGSMRDIVEVGYRYSVPQVRDWLRRNPQHRNRAGLATAWRHNLTA